MPLVDVVQKQARALQPGPLADFPRDSMPAALREVVDAMTKVLVTVKDTMDKAEAKSPVKPLTMLPGCPEKRIGPRDGR